MEKLKEPTINAILGPNKQITETAPVTMPMLYEVILKVYTQTTHARIPLTNISQVLRETVLQHCKWLKSETIHLKFGKQPVATNRSVAIQVLCSPNDLAETSRIAGRHVRMAHLHQHKGITKYGQKRAILINKEMPEKIIKRHLEKI